MSVITFTDANENDHLSGEVLEKFIQTMRPTIVTLEVKTLRKENGLEKGLVTFASGTLVHKGAHILSCYHAFRPEKNDLIRIITCNAEFTTNFDSNNPKKCSVVEFDDNLDLAILRILEVPNGIYNVASISQSAPFVGQDVYRISNPRSLPFSFESGIVSSHDPVALTVCGVVGTVGSSGSSLLNQRGEIMGITSMGESSLFMGKRGTTRVGNKIVSPSYEQLVSFVQSKFPKLS